MIACVPSATLLGVEGRPVAVEVHVSNVRKKLGKDFITTRRGLGYMLDA